MKTFTAFNTKYATTDNKIGVVTLAEIELMDKFVSNVFSNTDTEEAYKFAYQAILTRRNFLDKLHII